MLPRYPLGAFGLADEPDEHARRVLHVVAAVEGSEDLGEGGGDVVEAVAADEVVGAVEAEAVQFAGERIEHTARLPCGKPVRLGWW